MNCFNHPNESAVGTCQDCKKGLCQNCATKYEISICNDCNSKRIQIEKTEIIKNLLAIIFIGGFLFLFNKSISKSQIPVTFTQMLFSYYACCSIVAGWRFLNKITPQMFLFLPIIGWVIYFFVKLFISALIGFFVLPYILFRDIKRYIELRKIPT